MCTLHFEYKSTTFYAHTQIYFVFFCFLYKFRQFLHLNQPKFHEDYSKTLVRLK